MWQVPEEFVDPILGSLMTDPVVLPDSKQASAPPGSAVLLQDDSDRRLGYETRIGDLDKRFEAKTRIGDSDRRLGWHQVCHATRSRGGADD